MANRQQDAPKAKRPSLAAAARDAIVIVEVGPEHEKYHVHKVLLTYHSGYFYKALQGSWKEADEGVVLLHDVEPIAFKLFVHWLYTNRIPDSLEESARILEFEPGTEKNWSDTQFSALIKGYVFGDRFLAQEFRRVVSNRFVDALRDVYFWNFVGQATSTYAFANIPSDRRILQLLADDYIASWVNYESKVEHFSAAAQKELPVALLTKALRGNRDAGPEGFLDYDEVFYERCYYEHSTEEEEEKCSKKHMTYNEVKDYGYFE